EAGYEAGFYGIRRDGHHDRDRAGGLLQGQTRRRGFGCDHVHLETDQLARQSRQSIRMTVGIAILDDDVLTLAVAKIPEALAKPLAPERDIAGGEGREKSYARNLFRRLRLGNELRCKKTDNENQHEPDPPQGHGWRESSRTLRRAPAQRLFALTPARYP